MKLSVTVMIYALCWFLASWLLDPALPYDAVEALNWASNGEWGSPKNPWLPGAIMQPLIYFKSLPVSPYWYAVHFIAVSIGLTGVAYLARELGENKRLACFSLLSCGVSGVINFDIIPYNDNYLLVMLWPWMYWLFYRSLTQTPWWWLAFGLVSGLAVMAKYSSLAPVIMVVLTPFFSPALRRHYAHPAFWLGLLIGCGLALPNLWWLAEHNFSAFRWVDSQIRSGLNLHVLVKLLSVFYPVAMAGCLLKWCGLKLARPADPAVRAMLMVFMVPLAVITLWFLLHNGGRLTEWLQPFLLPALALLPALYRGEPDWHRLHRSYRFYLVCALLILLGYILVMSLNVKNAGEKMSGIKPFSQQVEQLWQQQFASPLRYVGGEHLSEWLTVYVSTRPDIITPWDNEKMPGIYNAHLTRARLETEGAVIIGQVDKSCQDEHFLAFHQAWPGMVLSLKRQLFFTADPHAKPVPVCIGFIAPAQ
ncbi:hypothetical protein BL250_15465 [Erwinia sp. OLTSP20]|uniref:glycosyltransferase family 39 protein n=1 Tax=unclassified Erwinia TaxID=2622719 RepID=UPI000C1848D2|nr:MULTISPECIES: glycosyltransferase family 39 protein [unclassified Erwinia]PIJ48606.1 hypothetical protein BV501_16485 [Erwinia sp. OAMSP11]PIJ68960.1 hypothetical protein BK416_15725 [Erwinia sp. OLSSP12]PIJ78826.1 hypothetical protein BLD47_16530 [Erwinia sp. OLCASP19]PIJ79924.1 hypothetical protein BLD46_16375 [Erwinia sp. OLMTSP26]PIJ82042.1 hypothetical protein BLD49_15890 [Erwinia sp. OLMDSP33]